MIARRTIGSPPIVKQESSLGQDIRTAFGGYQKVQKDKPLHMSRTGKASAVEPTPSESTSYPMVRNPLRPISRWETYDETQPHLNEPAGTEGYKSFNNPAVTKKNTRAEITTEIVAPANAIWTTSRGDQKRPERHAREESAREVQPYRGHTQRVCRTAGANGQHRWHLHNSNLRQGHSQCLD
jgi:hypothetical protein